MTTDATTSTTADTPRIDPPDLHLPVRRLQVDLASGFPATWIAGDAFRTHYFNALSMSFPIGEQFFIDSVKAGVATLPEADQARWQEVVRGFVGQEATHRFLHGQFNVELERQGLVNRWEGWARWRISRAAHLHPVNHVAVTAALEHFTAVLAGAVLTHPAWLEGCEPKLATLWQWHAAEESEHKEVAMDLYRAMGGSEKRRVLWFLWVGFLFLLESNAQTFINLWKAGEWWKPRTWWQALRWNLGPGGVFWATAWPLLRYVARGFHPNDLESPVEAVRRLDAQRAVYRVVGE